MYHGLDENNDVMSFVLFDRWVHVQYISSRSTARIHFSNSTIATYDERRWNNWSKRKQKATFFPNQCNHPSPLPTAHDKILVCCVSYLAFFHLCDKKAMRNAEEMVFSQVKDQTPRSFDYYVFFMLSLSNRIKLVLLKNSKRK